MTTAETLWVAGIVMNLLGVVNHLQNVWKCVKLGNTGGAIINGCWAILLFFMACWGLRAGPPSGFGMSISVSVGVNANGVCSLIMNGIVISDVVDLGLTLGYPALAGLLFYNSLVQASILQGTANATGTSGGNGHDFENGESGERCHHKGDPVHDAKLKELCRIFDKTLGKGKTLFNRALRIRGRQINSLHPDNQVFLPGDDCPYVIEVQSSEQELDYLTNTKYYKYYEAGLDPSHYIVISKDEAVLANSKILNLISKAQE
jgi:hypothetical protein